MPEIILSITIIGLLVFIAVSQYITAKEREKTMKVIIAKSLREVTDNEALDKIPPPTDEPKSDVVALTAEDDMLFDKHIQEELKAHKEEFEKDELTL